MAATHGVLTPPLWLSSPAQLGQRTRRLRAAVAVRGVRCTPLVVAADQGDAPKLQSEVRPFTMERELSQVQGTLKGLPAAARYVAGGALVAAAAGLGYTAGGKLGTAGKVLGTVTVGVGAAYGVVAAEKERKGGAPVELNNALLGREPCSLQPEEVAAIDAQWGVEMSREYTGDLKAMYNHYLTSLMPLAEVPLGGWEADALIQFKNALGLEDADAAEAHVEVGRTIFRMRSETSSRDGEMAERGQFQKLVFLSNLVFGEAKARFLLPWKRLFNVSDAQIALACKTNGAEMYRKYLAAAADPGAADKAVLEAARNYQTRINLDEGEATSILAALCRERVEKQVDAASDILKSSGRTRIRDVSGATAILDDLLAYNASMVALAGDVSLAPGVGAVSLFGGRYHAGSKMDDLRDLYRMYVAENIKGGDFSDATEAKLTALQGVFGMGAKEAVAVQMEVQTKAYRNNLRRIMADGTLEAAESKASMLTNLCSKLKFPGETAAAVHAELYKLALDKMLEAKSLSEADEEQLLSMRVSLCIPEGTVTEAHKERCGAIFRDSLELALGGGIDGFSLQLKDKVVKAAQDLRLDQDLAVELLKANVIKVFMNYVKQAKSKSTRLDQAKELKKMVYFSNLVVQPLLEGIRPPTAEEIEAEKAQAEIAKIMKEAQAAAKKEEEDEKAEAAKAEAGEEEVVGEEMKSQAKKDQEEAKEEEGEVKSSIAKTEAAEAAMADGEMVTIDGQEVKVKSQKVITLKDSMEERDRKDLYRNYLLYCMSGDQVDLPMGSSVVIERDQTEFLRLSQLGDVLGLTQLDVADVHKGLAEQAFRTNVQQVLADGNMTKEKSEYLKGLQGQLGLPEDAAKVIIRGVMNSRLMSNVQAQVSQGKMTLAEVRNLAAQDVDIESMMSADMRAVMYRKEVERLLSTGTGAFDAVAMLEETPKLLVIDAEKAKAVVQEISKERKRDSLVSAVAQVRQKDAVAAAKSINNLLACHLAAPEVEVSWPIPEELQDLYSLYTSSGGADTATLAAVLKLDDSTVAQLNDIVRAGNFTLVEEKSGVDEEALF